MSSRCLLNIYQQPQSSNTYSHHVSSWHFVSWPMSTFLATAIHWCCKSRCHSWLRALPITGLDKSVLCSKLMTWDDDNIKAGECGLKHRFKLCLNYATGIPSSQLPHVKIGARIHFLACFSCALFLNCVVLDSEKMSYFTPGDDVQQLHVVAAKCPAPGGSSYNKIPNPTSLTKSRWDMAFLLFHCLKPGKLRTFIQCHKFSKESILH